MSQESIPQPPVPGYEELVYWGPPSVPFVPASALARPLTVTPPGAPADDVFAALERRLAATGPPAADVAAMPPSCRLLHATLADEASDKDVATVVWAEATPGIPASDAPRIGFKQAADGAVLMKQPRPGVVGADAPVTVFGAGSGRRSAVVSAERLAGEAAPATGAPRMLRLKGCGDLNLGWHHIELDAGGGPDARTAAAQWNATLAPAAVVATETQVRQLVQHVQPAPPAVAPVVASGTVQELRGCMFRETAVRELDCVHRANDALRAARPDGFALPAMEPAALWVYSPAAVDHRAVMAAGISAVKKRGATAGDASDAAVADGATLCLRRMSSRPLDWVPACAVFRCHGDRRLESHLLRGVDRLLKLLCATTPAAMARAATAWVAPRWPSARLESGGRVTPAGELLLGASDLLDDGTGAGTWAADNLVALSSLLDPDAKTPADLADVALPASIAADKASPWATMRAMFPSFAEEKRGVGWGGDDAAMGACLTQCWSRAAEALSRAASSSPNPDPRTSLLPALLRLMRRLGDEAATSMAALHSASLCWGTYDDVLGTHCNAHTNNFAVLAPPSPPATAASASADVQLLGLVDFDMAYTVRTEGDAAEVKTHQQNVQTEVGTLPLILARCPFVSNSGVGEYEDDSEAPSFEDAAGAPPGPSAAEFQAALQPWIVAARDALLWGYAEGRHAVRTGAAKTRSPAPVTAAERALVEVALLLTHNVIA